MSATKYKMVTTYALGVVRKNCDFQVAGRRLRYSLKPSIRKSISSKLQFAATVFAILCGHTAMANDYDVEGYGDSGYVYGEIETDGAGNIEGYVFLEDGREIYIDGEFDGYGHIEAYDEDGYYYELEVE